MHVLTLALPHALGEMCLGVLSTLFSEPGGEPTSQEAVKTAFAARLAVSTQ